MSKIKIKTTWGIIECSHTNIKHSYDGMALIVKTNTLDLRIPNIDLIEPTKPLYIEKKHAYLKWRKELNGQNN